MSSPPKAPQSTCSDADSDKKIKAIVDVEELEESLFRGTGLWKPTVARATYGGHVIAQTLAAATRTITDVNKTVHSIHCYFIRPGNADVPVIYRVSQARDDANFSSRTVRASQHGKTILTLQASYHNVLIENSEVLQRALSYQSTMSDLPHHSKLMSIQELIAQKHPILGSSKILHHDNPPIDVKPVNPAAYFQKAALTEPKRCFWIRVQGSIGADQNLNRCLLAYVSDWSVIRTAFAQYPEFRYRMVASLDHSIWFHHPIQADDWMLYECEATIAGHCRALVFGKLYREDGMLSATVAQECLLRPFVAESKL